VMVARYRSEGYLERGEQLQQMLVSRLRRCVDEVAGNHHEIGPWREAVELLDATRQSRRGVDPPIGAHADRFDVEIRDLRDEDPLRRTLRGHRLSPGSRRTASGSTASPTRSPVLSGSEFGTSTMIAFAAMPPIAARRRSPAKRPAATCPHSAAPSAAPILIDSGRIITTTGSLPLPSPAAASLPPRNTSDPSRYSASTILAAPTNSATKRLEGAK